MEERNEREEKPPPLVPDRKEVSQLRGHSTRTARHMGVTQYREDPCSMLGYPWRQRVTWRGFV